MTNVSADHELKSISKNRRSTTMKCYGTHTNVVVFIGPMINLCFHYGTLRFPFALL